MKGLPKAPTKTLSITEFKAHCTEELRLVEESGERIAITRHGKTIAFVESAKQDKPKTVAHLMGSMTGSMMYSKNYDPDEPAIPFEDWTMHNEEAE